MTKPSPGPWRWWNLVDGGHTIPAGCCGAFADRLEATDGTPVLWSPEESIEMASAADARLIAAAPEMAELLREMLRDPCDPPYTAIEILVKRIDGAGE